ncbi:MAG: AtpZ/AtpI family protein [Microgenomates group bacterium]
MNNLTLAKSLNIGYYMLTPLLGGVFLGLLLDKYFKTKGIFVILFIVLGTISSFYNLYKLVKES